MRVIQLLTTLSFGDAVGNNVVALKSVLESMDQKTAIYAENIDVRLPEQMALPINQLPKLAQDDIVIYHLSTGTPLNYKVADFVCRKIMVYHNVTPPSFFKGYSEASEILCSEGLKGVEYLADKVDYCIADSDFNKSDLEAMNYRCKIDVLPILIAFDDYQKQPNKMIINRYQDDGYTNILFTGRIAPNKKHEDLIKSFYYYQKYINPKSRLILVGSYGGMEKYYGQLRAYAHHLGLNNVIFTGHIKFDEILAYYKIADVFLCLSEHEGFCVPLVEAMYFDIPVIAYNSCAIPYTLGGSGVMTDAKDPRIIAELIHKVVTDEALKEHIIVNQKKRLKAFSHDVISRQFKEYLRDFLGDKNSERE